PRPATPLYFLSSYPSPRALPSFPTRRSSDLAARCWSSQNPGWPSSSSSSAMRFLSPSGSKVITDPVQLGPDLLELLAQRLVVVRSEEHTSELQSLAYLVCRLLLEKKNNKRTK